MKSPVFELRDSVWSACDSSPLSCVFTFANALEYFTFPARALPKTTLRTNTQSFARPLPVRSSVFRRPCVTQLRAHEIVPSPRPPEGGTPNRGGSGDSERRRGCVFGKGGRKGNLRSRNFLHTLENEASTQNPPGCWGGKYAGDKKSPPWGWAMQACSGSWNDDLESSSPSSRRWATRMSASSRMAWLVEASA